MKMILKFVPVLLAVALVSCQSESASEKAAKQLSPEMVENAATADNPAAITSGNPAFDFASETFEFGKITQGESVSYSFKFKNTGDSPLIISSANGSCGCTVPTWPKEPIAPGKEGVIEVTFNSEGKMGVQNKTVTLVANTTPNTKVLYLRGEILAP